MRAWNSTIGQFSYADVLNAPFAIAGGIAAQFAPPAYRDQIRSLSQPFSGTILDTPITIHGTLDVLGMVPVIGNVADVANGLLYLAEGNYLEAGLALAAAVPFAGLAAGGAKLAKNGANLVSGSRAVARISNGLGSVASVSRAGLNNVAAFGRKGVNAFADGVRNVANRGRRVEVPSSTRRAQSTSPSGCNSFVPGTLVLMADGSLVAIEDIELGDEVWATDPETGVEGPRSVEALIEGEGVKVLVAITTADGGVFVATDGHPIWEVTEGEWTAAAHLEAGDVLLGEDGPVAIAEVSVAVLHTTVFNLTVEDLHTFSVSNGFDEILTHNMGGSCPLTSSVSETPVSISSATNKVDDVIAETTNRSGQIDSQFTLSADEALDAGDRFVGPGYTELGAAGSGVFRSADGLRGFRIDRTSIQGLHRPNVPHVHLEIFTHPGGAKHVVNNHIPFLD